jgi:hypothetical protein
MAVNDPEHPELARERQDVDVPIVALAAEKNYPTGRGSRNPSSLHFSHSDDNNRRRRQYSPSDARRASRSKGAQSTRSNQQQGEGQLEGQRSSSRTRRKGQRKALRTQEHEVVNIRRSFLPSVDWFSLIPERKGSLVWEVGVRVVRGDSHLCLTGRALLALPQQYTQLFHTDHS